MGRDIEISFILSSIRSNGLAQNVVHIATNVQGALQDLLKNQMR